MSKNTAFGIFRCIKSYLPTIFFSPAGFAPVDRFPEQVGDPMGLINKVFHCVAVPRPNPVAPVSV